MAEILYIDAIIGNSFYHITDQDKTNNIIRIIRSWPINSYSSNLIDGDEYLIKVVTKNSCTEYKGKGEYPKGYKVLKDIIGDTDV